MSRLSCLNRVRSAILFAAALCPALFLTTPGAFAGVTNGGFETGDFSGWAGTGGNTVPGTASNVAPSNGNFQAELASQGTTVANVETQLGVPAGTLDELIQAKDSSAYKSIACSAITQSITANAGDVLSFDWNMLTNEGGGDHGDDFVAWTLVGLQGGSILASVEDYAEFSSTGDIFVRYETGYKTVNYVIPTAGTYLLGFTAVDTITPFHDSYLLVDNVALTPEPTCICGLVAMGMLLRRRR